MNDVKLTFIGDCHGLFHSLSKLCCDPNVNYIQLGDMGLGFGRDEQFPIRKNLWFVRGNHDCPAVCRRTPGYLGDYGYNEELGFGFVSGAWSIDRGMRTEGLDWWPDEELSYKDCCAAVDDYRLRKPQIMVSHDCPSSIYQRFGYASERSTSTAQMLEVMLELHRPEIWVFAHHHLAKNFVYDGTRFVCLDEMQTWILKR